MRALLTLLLAAALLLPLSLRAASPPAPIGTGGAVSSGDALATEAGLEILRAGGNAVDAAVATALALAVTFPEAGNLGGGGFMLVHPTRGGKPVVFEYRETAPAAATATMFRKGDSMRGHRVVGVPGTVRGLA